MIRRAATLLFVLLAAASAGAEQPKKKDVPLRPIAPLDLAQTLDLYASGRFDTAVQAVARAGDEVGRNLRRHWAVTGRAWIDGDPGHRPHRLLAAAALALETENIRAERGDWRESERPLCAAACVLDWAQLQLLERGDPDEAERAWYLAAAALAGGVRDWRYLQRAVDPARPSRILPGLMDRARIRFPADPEVALEQALAAAGRFNVIAESGALPSADALRATRALPGQPLLRSDAREAADLLTALRDDPAVGVEARVRLGYLYFAKSDDAASAAELALAAERARDPGMRYLANFLVGWTAAARGDAAAAIHAFDAALDARPASESASVALAALELQRGDPARAEAVAAAALEHKGDVDPWRQFLYGHHPRLPALIAALRREVAK